MASVVAFTTLDLQGERKSDFIRDLGLSITDGLGIAANLYSMMWVPLQKEDCLNGFGGDREVLNLFAYSAAGKTIPQKRAMVKNAYEVVERYFGKDAVSMVVIIKDHADENVGLKGRLRLDIKAEAEAAAQK